MAIFGLVPGAMKPYHAGHHYLVQQAIKECDVVVVYTSTKDRKGISGLNMQKVWKQLILPKMYPVSLKFVVSPVGSTYDFIIEAHDNGSNDQIRIYGGTQDAKRFPIDNIRKRWPKANVVNVADEENAQYLRGQGDSPNAKGEWVRNAIQAGNHQQFREYLPEFLKEHANEYLRILTSETNCH